ncbi:hypothetical protein [Nostoc sp. LPT]|uniref:hypothetical protein n=1 Tax=Nostoc sp. LPT TaxID=2815387 RepID=UPI001D66359F|nr:hypothetical protein [Nostoc sp. LPT]MBN4004273.1 hypothetical protein [Nostoc sp. LPT]
MLREQQGEPPQRSGSPTYTFLFFGLNRTVLYQMVAGRSLQSVGAIHELPLQLRPQVIKYV